MSTSHYDPDFEPLERSEPNAASLLRIRRQRSADLGEDKNDEEMNIWRSRQLAQRDAELKQKTDVKVEVEDESPEVEKATLPATTPAAFENELPMKAAKFGAHQFANAEQFEYFCMLPLPDSKKQELLAAMRCDQDKASQ